MSDLKMPEATMDCTERRKRLLAAISELNREADAADRPLFRAQMAEWDAEDAAAAEGNPEDEIEDFSGGESD